MTGNLLAEMVKMGYKTNQISKIIANTINCTEKTARNKINGISDFTVPEAVCISSEIFKDQFDIGYLFKSIKQTA